MFEVIEVPGDAPERFESVGTKPKFWFDKQRKLFKECRKETGEDWAEKIAAELADQLGLPHAAVDLAVWQEKHGIVTPSFVPRGATLLLGNELLGAVIEGYPVNAPGTREHYQVPQHTLNAIFRVVDWDKLEPPIESSFPPDASTSADVFVGYLLLDAWIANQDRHHLNWGVVMMPPSDVGLETKVHLAPTFDHASSLGRNESDDVRAARLATKDEGYSIAAYVRKARSAIYEREQDARPLTTFDSFCKAAQRRPKGAAAWLERLAGITVTDMLGLLEQVPRERLSDTGAAFACKMLEVNQQRLIDLRGDLP